MCTSEKVRKPWINPDFEPSTDVTGSSKQGYKWSHKEDLCPLKIKEKGGEYGVSGHVGGVSSEVNSLRLIHTVHADGVMSPMLFP